MRLLRWFKLTPALLVTVLMVVAAYFAIHYALLAPQMPQRVGGGLVFGTLAICLFFTVVCLMPKADR